MKVKIKHIISKFMFIFYSSCFCHNATATTRWFLWWQKYLLLRLFSFLLLLLLLVKRLKEIVHLVIKRSRTEQMPFVKQTWLFFIYYILTICLCKSSNPIGNWLLKSRQNWLNILGNSSCLNFDLTTYSKIKQLMLP